MKFPYIVIHEGKWFPAGTDVPVGDSELEVTEEVVAEPTKEEPIVVEDKPKEKTYKRNDINKMGAEELINLAVSLGLATADEELTCKQLKAILIAHLCE